MSPRSLVRLTGWPISRSGTNRVSARPGTSEALPQQVPFALGQYAGHWWSGGAAAALRPCAQLDARPC